MNGMFGDDRLDEFGDVLDKTRPRLLAALQRTAAVGANRGAMVDPLIDVAGGRPPLAFVPVGSSRCFAAFGQVWKWFV